MKDIFLVVVIYGVSWIGLVCWPALLGGILCYYLYRIHFIGRYWWAIVVAGGPVAFLNGEAAWHIAAGLDVGHPSYTKVIFITLALQVIFVFVTGTLLKFVA